MEAGQVRCGILATKFFYMDLTRLYRNYYCMLKNLWKVYDSNFPRKVQKSDLWVVVG